MSGIADFFKRLIDVHLFFWMLSFKRFDVLPLFSGIVIALGATDYLANQKIAGATLSIVLQFILYLLAFMFCYVWKEFRSRLVDIANNMICLSLCISVLAGLLAYFVKFVIVVPPLANNIGEFVERLLNDLRILFPWDSRYSLAVLLFVFSYVIIALNTVYVVGRHEFCRVLLTSKIVPLAVNIVIALIACFLVLWPIFDTYP